VEDDEAQEEELNTSFAAVLPCRETKSNMIENRQDTYGDWKCVKDDPPPPLTPCYFHFPSLKKVFVGTAVDIDDQLLFDLLPQHSLPEFYQAQTLTPTQWKPVLTSDLPKRRQRHFKPDPLEIIINRHVGL
jgi:hypothetical protein